MKKIAKSYWKNLPPVKLYLDDVEKIIEIMRESSSGVELTTDEYAFSDINDLLELHRDYITQLDISSKEPFISLHLGKSYAWIYVNEDKPAVRGIFERVKDVILSRKRNLPAFIASDWVPYVMTGLLIVALQLPRFKVTMWVYALLVTSIIALIGAFYWGHTISSRKYSLIILKRRVDQPSFWQRNKDRIIVGIIIALVSGVIGWVLRTLIK